ncbi:hypothetical protein J9305_05010 [Leptospira interrogans]|nr:hypothetical protein [Leptospira interrogans]EJP05409.1 hypothetical protein LEP1GSC007_1128 [Leptospira interrogans serovar Bulgarica str. Mallika]EJP16953.1 hypothetical protein LEP1GSC080_2590 [Leptospira interrogans str. FPW2026]EKO05666.1 hypothetical protein LEP1GSC077_3463 [Leptospira interrogans str. C10069]EMN67031.1 hypothetical protein LEP1GSC098_1523 [Leptospira interrogans serovar Grippotyphosa str. UI 08434]QCO33925.1 hypothetical protein E4414_13215 [Leptospira interrogans]
MWKILFQIFLSQSSLIFERMDVCDSGFGLIDCEINYLDFFVLSFLLVSFSPRFLCFPAILFFTFLS